MICRYLESTLLDKNNKRSSLLLKMISIKKTNVNVVKTRNLYEREIKTINTNERFKV